MRSEWQQAHRELRALLDGLDDSVFSQLDAAVSACVAALRAGGAIGFVGNGGSAADAEHLACELVGRFGYDRPAIRAIALTANSAILTALINDGYAETMYARRVEAELRPGDVLIGLTTSGTSPNMLRAFDVAGQIGVVRIAFTGATGGAISTRSDHLLAVPSTTTPRIQEAHIFLGHCLCHAIERAIHPQPRSAPASPTDPRATL